MSDIAVKVEGLGKRYKIAHQQAAYGRLSESISGAVRAPVDRLRGRSRETSEWIWALRDVSFGIRAGEAVGVIGRNGAGKSTLLKLLSRITSPSTGRATLRGRVGSLLEVGTGFHPELTGRENIYLSGAVLGMRRSEISARFDEIVDFSGVEQFLDTPVKRYSSGMQVRLGFAVAAHLEPEILFVDEVLAVGDTSFQRKSIQRLDDVARAGRTVVYVSHDLGSVSSLTRSCIYLVGGSCRSFGPTSDVVAQYRADSNEARRQGAGNIEYFRRSATPSSPIRITGVRATPPGETIPMGAEIEVHIDAEVHQVVRGVAATVTLRGSQGQVVAIIYSRDSGFEVAARPGSVRVLLRISDLPLAPGTYTADIGFTYGPLTQALDLILEFPLFTVANSGAVIEWANRPWGVLHPRQVVWGIGG